MLFEELRKIFKVRGLLVVLAFGLLYYMLFVAPQMKNYPGSYQMTVDVGLELLNKYGNEISPEEYRDFMADYERREENPGGILEEINDFIAGNALMADYGIKNVNGLEAAIEELTMDSGPSEAGTLLMEEIYSAFTPDDYANAMEAQIDLDIRKNYLALYRQEVMGEGAASAEAGTEVAPEAATEAVTGYYHELDGAQQRRVSKRDEAEVYGVLPYEVYDCTFKVFQFWAFFLVAAALFFIVPYIVKDNRSGARILQYTGKAGRRYDLIRMLAVIIAAGAVWLAGAAVFLWLCRLNHVLPFWNSPVSSFASGVICWLPLSLGDLILLELLWAAALTLGLALIAFCVTRTCTNYITAIAWMLPMLLVTAVFCGMILVKPLELDTPAWLAFGFTAAVAAAGLLCAAIGWFAGRRRSVD